MQPGGHHDTRLVAPQPVVALLPGVDLCFCILGRLRSRAFNQELLQDPQPCLRNVLLRDVPGPPAPLAAPPPRAGASASNSSMNTTAGAAARAAANTPCACPAQILRFQEPII